MTITVILTLLLIVVTLSVLLFKTYKKVQEIQLYLDEKESEYQKLRQKYQPLIDIDQALDVRQLQLHDWDSRITKRSFEHDALCLKLATRYKEKRDTYESLLKEVSVLEENLENISYGLYKPQYNYTTSIRYKEELERIRNRQKETIKDSKATLCVAEWNVGGSRREGIKMTNEFSKLMLRAFNGECDAAVSRVKWNNMVNMETRIEKAYEAINKLGSSHTISITLPYKNLKLEELRLEYELQEKAYQEKEEQRAIREQMKEEERAAREYERAQKEAEDEENRYQKALDKARLELSKGIDNGTLSAKITDLEAKLKEAQEQKARAISMAQLTKCGYVYVISNIGAFGEDVYKIGMTRRLEPLDRVKELGDASVPFQFDVHAMIYSENAPTLENTIHKKLSSTIDQI